MLINQINPWGEPKIVKKSNICLIQDHMPYFSMFVDSADNIKDFYGYVSFNKFLKESMPHVDTLIFNAYHCINVDDNYKTFYIEERFDDILSKYLSLRKNNIIDFSKKTKKFNYLSNKPREARFLTSAWIAKNYIEHDSYNYTQAFNSDDFKDVLNEFILTESLTIESKMLPKKWITVNPAAERLTANEGMKYTNNNINFYNGMKDIMSPTVFSIVIEPVFWEHGCMLTEKYMNAVFSGTIPIVNGYKVYDTIKKMGLDTFDDIIDTSAQFEKNPIYRILNLLEKNKNQLDNALDIIKNHSIQKRIENNIKTLENYNYNLARSWYSKDELTFLLDIFK